jgi:hypothetical protein
MSWRVTQIFPVLPSSDMPAGDDVRLTSFGRKGSQTVAKKSLAQEKGPLSERLKVSECCRQKQFEVIAAYH